MEQVWEQVLGAIEEKVGKTTTETWLKPIRPIALRDDTLHLEVPSALFRDWLLGNLIKPLKDALAGILGYPAQVVIHIGNKPQGELFVTNEEVEKADLSRSPRKGGLVANYTFSTFVVGAGNQFAHAAARAVADHPGNHYNPLFIYGGVGLGKTHLINAIGHETMVKQGRSSVFYLSSESFTNELIAHLRRDRMDDFKNKFRQADVLILDDVQFLSGRERTQEEFFHTFNSLHDAHKQIVLTSDKFPNEIGGLEERLRNRFEWGLIADIQPPDLETRIAILQKKAQMKKIALPSEVALYIASNVTSNVRELEGGLTRLGALAALTQSPVTIDFARQVLQNLVKGKVKEISVETVQKAVCKYFGIRVADLISKRRTHLVTFPRQVAMFLCRKLAGASYPMIGLRFGGKDHTTALYACAAIEKRLKKDEELRTVIDRIEHMVYGQRS
ncbi:MAG: chromosomal replication initiator protein DnaA [Deltaproteobacteria bacterium]|nr:chromosomal replication initiator protein DnaA [Deltaproteobacteria bacterium]